MTGDRKRSRLGGMGPEVREEDRLFSRSSETYQKVRLKPYVLGS